MIIKNKIKNGLLSFLFILIKAIIFLLLLVILLYYSNDIRKYNYKKPITFENYDLLDLINLDNATSASKADIDTINNIKKSIEAKSYLIYDLTENREVLSKESNDVYPLASLTKLMTAYLAISDCKVKINKNQLDELLIASDNDVAEYIANSCETSVNFISKMNSYANINKLNLFFTNPSGLDDERDAKNLKASNFGNAISIAKLLNMVYLKDANLLLHTSYKTFNKIPNTNTIVSSLPFIIGSKTGFTDVAGGNLATIYQIGPSKRIAIIVMSSTATGRFTDTTKLLDIYIKGL